MDKIELHSEKRTVLGKKVKSLRQQKLTPANLFGHHPKSIALQIDTGVLKRTLSMAGGTRLISLKIGKEKKSRQVMAREIQKNPLTGELLHVSFYEVRMSEKIQVEIPVVLTGEAPALTITGNSIGHELYTLTVECLPKDIPNQIEIDISSLSKTGDMIRVKDVPAASGIAILNDPEQPVVIVSTHFVEKEPVKETPEETPEETPKETEPTKETTSE